MTTAKSRTSTLRWADIDVGDEVTPLEIPLTTTMIVAGAIASRDFMPVHHDRGLRQHSRGHRTCS